jgi:hypothetical protein
MWKILACLALLIALGLVGCASAVKNGTMKASGDSVATERVGTVTTTTLPDGTVIEVCDPCVERTVGGGKGSPELYKAVAKWVAAAASIAFLAFGNGI